MKPTHPPNLSYYIAIPVILVRNGPFRKFLITVKFHEITFSVKYILKFSVKTCTDESFDALNDE